MHKNVLFLTLLFSCTITMTSDNQNQQDIESKSVIEQICQNPDIGPIVFEFVIDPKEYTEHVKRAITQNNADWKTVKTVVDILNFYPPQSLKSAKYKNCLKDYKDDQDRNLLHVACRQDILPVFDRESYNARQSLILTILYNNNVDIHAHATNGYNPLQTAVFKGNCRAIIDLKNLGADINAKESIHGRNAVWLAAYNNHFETIKTLHNLDADINAQSTIDARDNTRRSPIHTATEKDHRQSIETLYNLGADVDTVDYLNQSPLFPAAFRNNIDAIKWFCNKGADVNRIAHDGTTPMHHAAHENNTDAITELYYRGADIHSSTYAFVGTPLFVAVRRKNEKAVKKLLSYNANPESAYVDFIVNNANGATTTIHTTTTPEIRDLLEKAKIDQAKIKSNRTAMIQELKSKLDQNLSCQRPSAIKQQFDRTEQFDTADCRIS